MKWSRSVCIRSSSHTPVWLARGLQETSQKEGTDWSSIHQLSSECSVWARREDQRAGTELPEPLFISPDLIICNRGSSAPTCLKCFSSRLSREARQTVRDFSILRTKEKPKGAEVKYSISFHVYHLYYVFLGPFT